MILHADIGAAVARNVAFFEDERPGNALVLVRSIRELAPDAIRPLNEWDMNGAFHDYLAARADGQIEYFRRRAALDDDLLPSITPWYGIAELTAWAGGPVAFSAETSYHQTTIRDIANPAEFAFSAESEWYARVIGGMRFLREYVNGQLYVRMRGAACPIDIASALRGNELFYDMYDEPEALHALLARCAEGLDWWMGEQYEAADKIAGGVITGFETWMPGRAFGHLSEDASVLCSPEHYRQFGRPYTERALKRFDAAFVHTHSAGARAIPDIAAMQKARMIEISSDPKAPRAIDLYEALERQLHGKIIVLALTPEELMSRVDLLRRARCVLWIDVDTLKEARQIVAFARKAFAPSAVN